MQLLPCTCPKTVIHVGLLFAPWLPFDHSGHSVEPFNPSFNCHSLSSIEAETMYDSTATSVRFPMMVLQSILAEASTVGVKSEAVKARSI